MSTSEEMVKFIRSKRRPISSSDLKIQYQLIVSLFLRLSFQLFVSFFIVTGYNYQLKHRSILNFDTGIHVACQQD